MTSTLQNIYHLYSLANTGLTRLHSLAAVAVRIYIAQVFFSAGLTKIQDWETTLFLFEEEYQVPFLPFELAATLGTFGELFFPVLLFTGLFTRFSAIALFVINLVAVISLAEIAPAALYLHVIWGVLLAQLAIYGGGVIAVDKFLETYAERSTTHD